MIVYITMQCLLCCYLNGTYARQCSFSTFLLFLDVISPQYCQNEFDKKRWMVFQPRTLKPRGSL